MLSGNKFLTLSIIYAFAYIVNYFWLSASKSDAEPVRGAQHCSSKVFYNTLFRPDAYFGFFKQVVCYRIPCISARYDRVIP